MNFLQKIFDKQQELMDRYQEIEKDLLGEENTLTIDLDDREYQARLRRVAWWITEELAESMDELRTGNGQLQGEELIDALHFSSELCILSGITVDDIFKGRNEDGYFIEIIDNLMNLHMKHGVFEKQYISMYQGCQYLLGMTINCLKNKPWKQTPKPTDEEKYLKNITAFFTSLISLIAIQNNEVNSMEHVYHEYMKKHQINKERQDGDY